MTARKLTDKQISVVNDMYKTIPPAYRPVVFLLLNDL